MSSRAWPRRLFLASLALLFVAAAVALAGFELLFPYQGYRDEVFIDLARGTSTRQLAATLEENGVIRSRWAFLAWRGLHARAPLQAGEYHFDQPLSTREVFDKIRRGDIFFEQLVVPEGSNMFDIAAALQPLHSVSPEAFLTAASNPKMILDLDPMAPDLEGYLFPASYQVTRHTTAAQLCRTMTEQFRREWQAVGGRQPGIDAHEVVTVASMVEKEAAVPQDRPLIAAVFENRLRIGMPLQCDPTVVYAAFRENRYRGTIFKSDLQSGDPYNTYSHAGLPPGPIANPGIASLKAALQPAQAKYLYFVAEPGGSGRHTFSETLAQHQQAVKAYRRSQ